MHQNYSIGYSLPLKLRDKKPVIIPDAPVRVDGDNDGVVDSLDQCPNQKGLAKYNGCPIPDTDNDGVDDELDKCPNQAGTAKYKGCPIPDSDKDGINDEMDKCPTVSGLTRYGGCPIPDSDKDGINDEVDKCPNTPGIAGNNGCIDIQPLLEQAASNLKFASGKVILSKKNFAGLDTVVSLLNTYTNVTLLLGGNTDNVGSRKINQPLSEKRAAVVFKYLVKKGISPTRLIKEGFAETKPIADNKTAKGRAKNRRTDLNAKY
jgi:outer membrane protein OmpA-like peptidoglycan-associated protein